MIRGLSSVWISQHGEMTPRWRQRGGERGCGNAAEGVWGGISIFVERRQARGKQCEAHYDGVGVCERRIKLGESRYEFDAACARHDLLLVFCDGLPQNEFFSASRLGLIASWESGEKVKARRRSTATTRPLPDTV